MWYNSLKEALIPFFQSPFPRPLRGQPEKMAHTTTALRLWYNSLSEAIIPFFQSPFPRPLRGQPEKMADYPIRALRSWYHSLKGAMILFMPFFSPAAPGTEKHGGLSHSRFALMVS